MQIICCFIVQNVIKNFIKIMLIVCKIFVKVRRHLADFHTKCAKMTFCKDKLICNMKKLYAKDFLRYIYNLQKDSSNYID